MIERVLFFFFGLQVLIFLLITNQSIFKKKKIECTKFIWVYINLKQGFYALES